jgi:hypothetical protein
VIHVLGGTYLEFCREPAWDELFGSGLRAAGVLTSLGSRASLHTFVGSDQRTVLEVKAESAGIDLRVQEVPATLQFEYLHPLSRPTIEPELEVRAHLVAPRLVDVVEDKVLRFGVLEGAFRSRSRMAVYDPQSPSNPRPFGEGGSCADLLAIVANRSEVRKLAGRADPREACRSLIGDSGACIVVMKCGADGCLVATTDGIEHVPAFRTKRVWPIGSGDVFSAVFAEGWLDRGLSPVDAAMRASRATSHFVETRSYPRQEDLDENAREPLRFRPTGEHKQVYLAGPFFNLAQRWLIEEFREALLDFGLRVFSPLHEVGRGEFEAVYEPDMQGLKSSGVVLACLDGLDPGTIYEVGYAHSLGIPVIAFVSAEREEDLKMPLGGGARLVSDFATALYWTVWAATCE